MPRLRCAAVAALLLLGALSALQLSVAIEANAQPPVVVYSDPNPSNNNDVTRKAALVTSVLVRLGGTCCTCTPPCGVTKPLEPGRCCRMGLVHC
jgi:hypothetical protein